MPSTVHRKRTHPFPSGTVPIAVARPMTRARAKKAGALGIIWCERLASAEDALSATRVVLEMDPENPQLQRDYAKSLLRSADVLSGGPRAALRRHEAADLLCKLAAREADDRAFEAIELALEAVADHAAALTMLEQLAPRVGRQDVIQARWLSALKKAPRGPLARELRLKLAGAHIAAGSIEEARACLRALIRKRDPEALALAKTLTRTQIRRRGSQRSTVREEPTPSKLPEPVCAALAKENLPVVQTHEHETPPQTLPSGGEAKSGKSRATAPRIEERLLSSLQSSLSSTHEPERRLPLLLGIADLRAGLLPDQDEELRVYEEALSLAPSDAKLFERARRAFERAGRGAALTKRLLEIRESTSEASVRRELLRRAVSVRLAKEEDIDATISAHRELLRETGDADTRRSLIRLLEHKPVCAAELALELDQLARQVGRKEAKGLRLQRAKLLRHALSDSRAASDELQRIADELAPDDLEVLDLLATVAEEAFDLQRVASAKRRQLVLLSCREKRAALAEELASLCADELDDDDGAFFALTAWTEAAPTNRRPYFRLLPLLERRENYEELVKALDTVAALTVVEEEATEFLVHASLIESRLIGRYDSAWRRLASRFVGSAHVGAEKLLREIASISGRRQELAQLFVDAAMQAKDSALQVRRWMDAAREYEGIDAGEKALEAALRALASDMGNGTILDDVDRLVVAACAWERLTQVYHVLVERAESAEAKVRLLVREARLLEYKAKDKTAALMRMVLAAQLDPSDDDAYGEATRLANLTGQHEWALLLREQRAAATANRQQDLEALLGACAVYRSDPSDIPRARSHLASAVRRAGDDELVLISIEHAVKKLDAAQPAPDGCSLTSLLAEVLRQCAAEANVDPRLSLMWLLRATELSERSLGDARAAFDAVRVAARLAPSDENVLDRLAEAALRADKMDELVEHYRRASDAAIDSKTAIASLRRLARLLEDVQMRPDEAAEAYQRLLMLDPDDFVAADRLRACLRVCNRFNDLLAAIDRQLGLTTDYERQLCLLEEAAEIWETQLHNRSEALQTWRRISLLKPFDATVDDAISRLQKRPALDEHVLLGSEVVVLPEDLVPSVFPPKLEPSAEDSTSDTLASEDDTLASEDDALKEASEAADDEDCEWPLVAASEILEDGPVEEACDSEQATHAIFV